MQAEYEIIPNVTWGLAPAKITWTWKRRNCDLFLWLRLPPPPTDSFWEKAAPGPQRGAVVTPLESVAICIATTTRGIPRINKLMDLSLFLHTLPSITKTLDKGFDYHLYIGYDRGDPYFDNIKHVRHVTDWFTLKMKQSLITRQSIRITLHLHCLDNPDHKPGVAFNNIINIAYRNPNVTHKYFFRTTDDFQIVNHPLALPLDYVQVL
jgi:hypothetical protein